jgi:hypothetical protein
LRETRGQRADSQRAVPQQLEMPQNKAERATGG